MNNLYHKKEKTFPVTIDITGITYLVNADYRNILRIFAILADREISQYHRIEKLIQWFFVDMPDNVPLEQIYQAFADFVSPPKPINLESDSQDGEPQEKRFDYDFDSEEIYASFLSEYNIDLVEVEFLHWYKFQALLHNLSADSAFRKKIELRFMDISHYKGSALADMTRAREAVQLPVQYSEEDLHRRDEFDDLWGNL